MLIIVNNTQQVHQGPSRSIQGPYIHINYKYFAPQKKQRKQNKLLFKIILNKLFIIILINSHHTTQTKKVSQNIFFSPKKVLDKIQIYFDRGGGIQNFKPVGGDDILPLTLFHINPFQF